MPALPPGIESRRLPQRVALVMDGNGRWATRRGLVRTGGQQRTRRFGTV